MIHSIHSESLSGGGRALASNRSSGRSYQSRVAREHVHLPFGAWPTMSLAEPDIDSLWDNGLLDRLSAPITRFHE
jgi:hypothetical protein